jgi:hypothetical protein
MLNFLLIFYLQREKKITENFFIIPITYCSKIFSMGASASVENLSNISNSTLRDEITKVQKLYYADDKKDAALSQCYNICSTYYKDETLRDEKYQFLEFLVSVIEAPNISHTRANALNGIMWMSLHPPNSTRLCSVKLNLIPALINTMNNSVSDRLNSVKVLGNICKAYNNF